MPTDPAKKEKLVADLIRASSLWPPVRPRSIDLDAQTFELLEAVGLVRQIGSAGSFALMPLGTMIRDRMEAIIRKSFVEHGFGAAVLPVLQSRAIWESSGRWNSMLTAARCSGLLGAGRRKSRAWARLRRRSPSPLWRPI